MLPDIQEDQNNQSGRLKCLGPKFSGQDQNFQKNGPGDQNFQ